MDDIDDAGSITKYIGADGIGTIIFGRESLWWMIIRNTGMMYLFWRQWWWFSRPYYFDSLAFFDVKDAEHVYNLLVKIQRPNINELKELIDEDK